MQTQSATEEISRKIEALQRDAAGSVDAVHRISQAIEAIRPVFENVNGAVAEQNQTTGEMAENAASASHFIVSVGDSASEIDSATKEAEAHGDDVAKAGKAVTAFAQKLKSRCAVLLRQGDMTIAGTTQARAVALQPQNRDPDPARRCRRAGLRNFHGRHPDQRAGRRAAGAEPELWRDAGRRRRLQDSHRGAVPKPARRRGSRHRTPALREKIEDKMWAIHDENTEVVTRAMEAGAALTKIFENGVASGAISIEDMFDTDYVEIAGTNPLQHRTRILDWADRALPPFQEAFLAKDPRMVFCAMIDRNGYLPVHNKIYSHPQRPGDVAWNTANSRNRRIFNDPAGLAAGRNQRAYLIQSYARDMGNGNTVMMREIDVPVRVKGRHWGGFRTAYRL